MDAASETVEVVFKPLTDTVSEFDEQATLTILPSDNYGLGEIYSSTVNLKNTATCFQRMASGMNIRGDFNKDCLVDLQDFAQLASQWLELANF